MTLNLWNIGTPVRVDCASAVDYIEQGNDAILAAGRSEYAFLKFVAEMKRRGIRVILEAVTETAKPEQSALGPAASPRTILHSISSIDPGQG